MTNARSQGNLGGRDRPDSEQPLTSSGASSPSSASELPSDQAASPASESVRDPQETAACVSLAGAYGITPEMIDAATQVLRESGRLYSEADGVDQLVVEEMLLAALQTIGHCQIGKGRNSDDSKSQKK